MVSLTLYASDPPSPVVQSWAVGRTDGALHDPRETEDAWNAAHVAAPCGTRLYLVSSHTIILSWMFPAPSHENSHARPAPPAA